MLNEIGRCRRIGARAYRRNAKIVGEAARFAPRSERSKAGRFAYIELHFNNLQMSLHENLPKKADTNSGQGRVDAIRHMDEKANSLVHIRRYAIRPRAC
jgi:hypothetical protein